MTKERTLEQIKVMQAWVARSEIERSDCQLKGGKVLGNWEDDPDPIWMWGTFEYRVKPEPRTIWVSFATSVQPQYRSHPVAKTIGAVILNQKMKTKDNDLLAIKEAIRALDKSTPRMLRANLLFLWDRYIVHPKPLTVEPQKPTTDHAK